MTRLHLTPVALGCLGRLSVEGCGWSPPSWADEPQPGRLGYADPSARDCAPASGAWGFPDDASTGVSGPEPLRTVDGPLVVDLPGAVVENIEVHGSIDVEADGKGNEWSGNIWDNTGEEVPIP